MKLCLALQVWNGDVWTAIRLLKLINSIEPKKRDDIEFIVSARRDTNAPAVKQMAELAKEGFANVQVIYGKRFGTGWPEGCGDLWQETMMRTSQMRDAGKIKSDGVLTFEADCLPLRSDWLDVLASEWQKAKDAGKLVCGHAHLWTGLPGEEPTHINGNAIFHCAITDKYPQLNGSDARTGWDAYHGELLLKLGLDTFAIMQKYRMQSATKEEVCGFRKHGQIPSLFHGLKGFTGLEVIESMVKDGSFFER